MKKTSILFFASLFTVFFISIQGINVVRYYYGYAAITSVLISWSAFYLYKFVPATWYEFAAYCIGGLIGVELGMLCHQYIL